MSKIGKYVQVHPREYFVEKYPETKIYKSRQLKHLCVTKEMIPICGQCGTIYSIEGKTKEKYYKIKFDDQTLDGDWLFTKDMFSLKKKEKPV